MKLFQKRNKVGVFRGFIESGLEIHADIVLSYRSEFNLIPLIGQFVLVELENQDEALVGRITSCAPSGKLTSSSGEEYAMRAIDEDRAIREDIKQQFLKYRVNIRVLGLLRNQGENLIFSASHRRIPHMGSAVAFASDEVLKWLAGSQNGACIGYYALGESIYAGSSSDITKQPWMQIKEPEIPIKFPIKNLVARRSFIFARAGFGKSNLNKLLFSELYKNDEDTKISDSYNQQKRVGTMIFDPDGEYFWADNKGRPGLCDVEHLSDKLVVFTNKEAPNEKYNSFVAASVKLDIRNFKASDIVPLAVSTEKQDQQNIAKLKSLNQAKWIELVNLIYAENYGTDSGKIKDIFGADISDAELGALRSNMVRIVHELHDPNNKLFEHLKAALADGKLCIIDMSQMRGRAALVMSSIIIRQIFEHNANEFTKKDSRLIPTLLVIEEAQSILNSKDGAAIPFIEWVKEGRKYDLGSLMITQQPGSIPSEILSQGDNWFIMHLLSQGDLKAVKSANAHFSDDILSMILNESIPGQCVMWSSVDGKPYPVFMRVLDFNEKYKNSENAVSNYVAPLQEKIKNISNKRDELLEKMVNIFKSETFKNDIQKGIFWNHIIKKINQILADADCLDERHYLKKEDSNFVNGNIDQALNISFGNNWFKQQEPNNKGTPETKYYLNCQNSNC